MDNKRKSLSYSYMGGGTILPRVTILQRATQYVWLRHKKSPKNLTSVERRVYEYVLFEHFAFRLCEIEHWCGTRAGTVKREVDQVRFLLDRVKWMKERSESFYKYIKYISVTIC